MLSKDWKGVYQTRLSNVENAIQAIHSKQKVFLAPFCNEPQTLVNEMVRQKDRLRDVTLYNIIIGSPCIYADSSCHSHFKIRTFLASPFLKAAFSEGDCDYIPVNLSEISRWIKEEKIDVALIQVSPPNDQGYCNLGLSVDVVQTLIHTAKYVIAEVNSNMPWTYGNTMVHVTDIDRFVLSSHPLLSISPGKTTEIEKAIGQYVAELIPDSATIQVGLGSIADSILNSLHMKKGLGVHSGSITDPIIELMKQGIITNEFKEINQYKTVCTTITGSQNLYEFVNHNPFIELYPADYTHNAAVISKLKRFYAINSALEVDVFGQVNAEQVGSYPAAGVGGQMDFIHGARLSKGGRTIIALPSAAKKGTKSRIKLTVPYVTSLKTEIDFIVTEYGIASLFGKSLKERAKEMISIAHPNFRKELSENFKTFLPVS